MKTHTTPLFECDCFDCYTSSWFKWDSSPNRELIHQAIEAFEESLATSNEITKKKTKKKGHRSLAGKTVFPAPDQKGIQDSPKGQMGHRHFAEKSCQNLAAVVNGVEDLPLPEKDETRFFFCFESMHVRSKH